MNELIIKAITFYELYRERCNKLAREAQKYVDWDDEIGCEYMPADGICITTTDASVCSVETFFKFVKDKEKISYKEFKSICI